MTRGGVQVKCKGPCKQFFTQTQTSNFSDKALGKAAGSRCDECRAKYKKAMKSSGTTYIDVERSSSSDEEALGGLYRVGSTRPAPKAYDYPGVPTEEEAEKYKKADPFMDELVEKLTDPHGPRLCTVVLPTGFGKSTYMLYRLLISKISESGKIWCTEPRLSVLVPATPCGPGTVPWYVATQLLQAPGKGYGKGHEIGVMHGEDKTSMYDEYNNRLIYCTDGVLINLFLRGELDDVSLVVIDEAHEMSSNMCSLFSMLLTILRLYPKLRVVFASATVDPNHWVDFYKPYPVHVIMPQGTKTQHVIHIHWPDDENPEFEQVEGYQEHYGFAQALGGVGAVESPTEIPELVPKMIRAIREGKLGTLNDPYGDIVVFVPSTKLITSVEEALKPLQKELEAAGKPPLKVFSRHRNSTDSERAAFEASESAIKKLLREVETRATERGVTLSPQEKYDELKLLKNYQRVIVGTNYLETGVTMTVAYVFEGGFQVQNSWRSDVSANQREMFRPSRDRLRQRWGRVGRIASGEAFLLYKKEFFLTLDHFSKPEISRVNLDAVILTMLKGGLGSALNLKIFGIDPSDPMHQQELARAIRQLRATGAIDVFGRLTFAGAVMQKLSAETVNAGGMLLWSEAYGYAVEMATFLAFVDRGDLEKLFVPGPQGILGLERLRYGCLDDLEFYLRLFSLWDNKRRDHGKAAGVEWCEEYGLDHEKLVEIDLLREQKLTALQEGVHASQTSRAFDLERLHRIRGVVARAMREWVFIRTPEGDYTPAFPEVCAFRGRLTIDRTSSAAVRDDVQAFVCVGRKISGGNSILAQHIVQVDPDWCELLVDGQEVRFALQMKRELQKKNRFTDGTYERITGRSVLETALHQFKEEAEYFFEVRQFIARSDDKVQYYLVQERVSKASLIVAMNSERLEAGDEFRAVVLGVDEDRQVLNVTQKPILKAIGRERGIYRDVPVVYRKVNEETGKVSEVWFGIEPGIVARLTEQGCGPWSDLMQDLEVGMRCEVRVTGNNDWTLFGAPVAEPPRPGPVVGWLTKFLVGSDDKPYKAIFLLAPGVEASLMASDALPTELEDLVQGELYELHLKGEEENNRGRFLRLTSPLGAGTPEEGNVYLARCHKLVMEDDDLEKVRQAEVFYFPGQRKLYVNARFLKDDLQEGEYFPLLLTTVNEFERGRLQVRGQFVDQELSGPREGEIVVCSTAPLPVWKKIAPAEPPSTRRRARHTQVSSKVNPTLISDMIAKVVDVDDFSLEVEPEEADWDGIIYVKEVREVANRQ